jgi:uncharacterized membrane protein
MASHLPPHVPPASPSVLLGSGLGGFVDGIVPREILPWHHRLTSARYRPDSVQTLTINKLFDGLFHAVPWVATGLSLLLLHGAVSRGAAWSGYRLLGGMAVFRFRRIAATSSRASLQRRWRRDDGLATNLDPATAWVTPSSA